MKEKNRRTSHSGENLATVRERHFSKIGSQGITLIALVITMIVSYDKMKECCNM